MNFASGERAASAGRAFLESCPGDEIPPKAKRGRDALHRFSYLDEYGCASLGADIGIKQRTRFHTPYRYLTEGLNSPYMGE